jgi:hypothetical protein
MTARPVPRLHRPQRQDFEERFVEPGLPVILTGLLDAWPAWHKWEVDYLRQRVGQARVDYKVSATRVHPDFYAPARPRRRSGTLESYLERITTGDEAERARYYLSGDREHLDHPEPTRVNPDLQALREDLGPLPYFPAGSLRAVGFWLSARGVRSATHFDGNGGHNLNAQIRGSKRVWLFPPQAPLPLRPVLALEQSGIPPWFSPLDPESEEPEGCQRADLQAGEVLFIPSFWYHAFLHSGAFNCNVNFWWTPERLALHATSLRWAFLGSLRQVFGDSLPEPAREGLLGLERALLAWKPPL